MEEEYKPKFSVIEIVFITPFYLISDAFDILIALAGLDDFGIISLIRTSVSEFYFIVIKKMRTEIWMIGLINGAISAIPYIGEFVPSTIGWAIMVYMDRVGLKKVNETLAKAGPAGKLVKKVAEKAIEKGGKS